MDINKVYKGISTRSALIHESGGFWSICSCLKATISGYSVVRVRKISFLFSFLLSFSANLALLCGRDSSRVSLFTTLPSKQTAFPYLPSSPIKRDLVPFDRSRSVCFGTTRSSLKVGCCICERRGGRGRERQLYFHPSCQTCTSRCQAMC